jgi:hypothetical protein
MSITVKKLIQQLEQIENKLLEVEVCLIDKGTLEPSIEAVRPVQKKVLIFLERKIGLGLRLKELENGK